ncbi:50S ribosomal protein L1 [Mycoplasmopsis agassizii]
MMAKIGKKLKSAKAQVDKNIALPLLEAIKLAKETSYAKFDASIDLAIRLNLDTRKSDQQLRGAVLLPNGNGKTTKVLVLTETPASKEAALQAGADLVLDRQEFELWMKEAKFDVDVIVADPKMMPVLGKYGKQLGPKGLMPNPRLGTVTPTPEKTVVELKKGKANYRADKFGIVHSLIGKQSMSDQALSENAKVLLDTIKRLKPAAVKGVYIKNVTVSSSMGPSVKIAFD